MKFLLIYLFFLIQHRINLYFGWSRVYNFLFNGDAVKNHPVDHEAYKTFGDVEQALSFGQWRKDGIRTLGDAIAAPERFQKVLDTGVQATASLDCDDFSMYALVVLDHMFKSQGTVEGKILTAGPYLMSVVWLDAEGKQNGHNVCVFQYQPVGHDVSWAWVSNWYEGVIQWNCSSMEEISEKVVGQDNLFVAAQTGYYKDGWLKRHKFRSDLDTPFRRL